MSHQKKIENLLQQINKLLLISKTSLTGNITFANDLFCKTSQYSREELINKPHNIVRHPDMSSEIFKDMWNTIKSGKIWSGKVMNKTKNNEHYITYTTIAPIFDDNNNIIEYLSLRFLITEEETRNIEFKKSATKLLNQYKTRLDAYEKNKDNLELKRVLNENQKLIQEVKNFNNNFEMNFNAKNKLLLTEMQILRNNNNNYQIAVESLKENNLKLLEEIKELKNIIYEKDKEIDSLERNLENEKSISKSRLDLINDYENTKKSRI